MGTLAHPKIMAAKADQTINFFFILSSLDHHYKRHANIQFSSCELKGIAYVFANFGA
jgi:hypothetical protein